MVEAFPLVFLLVGGFSQPIWKTLVKLYHLPKNRDENKNIWNHQLALPKLNLYFFNSPKWFVTSPPSYWKYTNPCYRISPGKSLKPPPNHHPTPPSPSFNEATEKDSSSGLPTSNHRKTWVQWMSVVIGSPNHVYRELMGPIHQVVLPEKLTWPMEIQQKPIMNEDVFSYSKKFGWFSRKPG